MDKERLLDRINTAANILDGIRAELINEDSQPKKSKAKGLAKKLTEEITKPLEEMSALNQELTVKQCLERYGQPTDDEHVESVNRIVSSNGITLEQLDSCLERVKYANDKDPKNDIRKYTYSCLYKVNSKA